MLVINQRLWGPILLLAILGGVAGFLYEQQNPGSLEPHAALVGFVAGAALGFPVGLFMQQQKRRWIAAAALAVILFLAYVIGGYWDALFAVASIVIVYFVSAAVLRDLYGGSEMEAFWHHLRILFAARGGMLIVEEGKIAMPSGKGPHMGPMRVIVKPGNAVVMESGSRTTRICGPSVFQSNNFEYVKQVLDIRRVRRSALVKDIMTEDLVPIVVEVAYVVGIDLSPETMRGENGSVTLPDTSQGVTAAELTNLRNVVTSLPNWQDYVNDIVSSAVREVMATEKYSKIVRTEDYGSFANRVHEKVRRRTSVRGIRVDSTQLTRISPAPILLDALASGESIKTREQAAGEAWRMAISAISLGYGIAMRNGMRPEDIHRETQRFMMEHISHDQATKIVMAADPNARMDGIQQPSSVIDGLIDEPRTLPNPTTDGDRAS